MAMAMAMAMALGGFKMKEPKFKVYDKVMISIKDSYLITVIDKLIQVRDEWRYVSDECIFPEDHITLAED